MLRYYNYDVVCQEIVDEITLAVNITNCPNHCEGCHSQWLWEDTGEELTEKTLYDIVSKYASAITCVCFMGGDREPEAVEKLAEYVHATWPELKVAWYSGREKICEKINKHTFQYIKTGPYKKELGGLKSRNTNQRLYKINAAGEDEDITYCFWK